MISNESPDTNSSDAQDEPASTSEEPTPNSDSPSSKITDDELIESDHFVSVSQGNLVLNGNISQLAGIEVASAGGYLSMSEIELQPGVWIPARLPFSLSAVVVRNTPSYIAMGVLGPDNRIDLTGTTPTSIVYEPPVDVDPADDLQVYIGADGITVPRRLPLHGDDVA